MLGKFKNAIISLWVLFLAFLLCNPAISLIDSQDISRLGASQDVPGSADTKSSIALVDPYTTDTSPLDSTIAPPSDANPTDFKFKIVRPPLSQNVEHSSYFSKAIIDSIPLASLPIRPSIIPSEDGPSHASTQPPAPATPQIASIHNNMIKHLKDLVVYPSFGGAVIPEARDAFDAFIHEHSDQRHYDVQHRSSHESISIDSLPAHLTHQEEHGHEQLETAASNPIQPLSMEDNPTPGFPIDIMHPEFTSVYVNFDVYGEINDILTPGGVHTAFLEIVLKAGHANYRNPDTPVFKIITTKLISFVGVKCDYFLSGMTSPQSAGSTIAKHYNAHSVLILTISKNVRPLIRYNTVLFQCSIPFEVNTNNIHTLPPPSHEPLAVFQTIQITKNAAVNPTYEVFNYHHLTRVIVSPLLLFDHTLESYDTSSRPPIMIGHPITMQLLLQDIDLSAGHIVTLQFQHLSSPKQQDTPPLTRHPFAFYSDQCDNGQQGHGSLPPCDIDQQYIRQSEWICTSGPDNSGNELFKLVIDDSFGSETGLYLKVHALADIKWTGVTGSTRVNCHIPFIFDAQVELANIYNNDGISLQNLITTQSYKSVYNPSDLSCVGEALQTDAGVAISFTCGYISFTHSRRDVFAAARLSTDGLRIHTGYLDLFMQRQDTISCNVAIQSVFDPEFELVFSSSDGKLPKPTDDTSPIVLKFTTMPVSYARIHPESPRDLGFYLWGKYYSLGVLTLPDQAPQTHPFLHINVRSIQPPHAVPSSLATSTPYFLDVDFNINNPSWIWRPGESLQLISSLSVLFPMSVVGVLTHECTYHSTESQSQKVRFTFQQTDPTSIEMTYYQYATTDLVLSARIQCEGILVRFHNFSPSQGVLLPLAYCLLYYEKTPEDTRLIISTKNLDQAANPVSAEMFIGSIPSLPITDVPTPFVYIDQPSRISMREETMLRFRLSPSTIESLFSNTSTGGGVYCRLHFPGVTIDQNPEAFIYLNFYDPENDYQLTAFNRLLPLERFGDSLLLRINLLKTHIYYISPQEVTIYLKIAFLTTTSMNVTASFQSHNSVYLDTFFYTPVSLPTLVDTFAIARLVDGKLTPTNKATSTPYRIQFDFTSTMIGVEHRITQPYDVYSIDPHCISVGGSPVGVVVLSPSEHSGPDGATYDIVVQLDPLVGIIQCTFYADVLYSNQIEDLTATIYVNAGDYEVNSVFSYPPVRSLPLGVLLEPNETHESIDVTIYNTHVTQESSVYFLFFQAFPDTLRNGTRITGTLGDSTYQRYMTDHQHSGVLGVQGDNLETDYSITYYSYTLNSILSSEFANTFDQYAGLETAGQPQSVTSSIRFIQHLQRVSQLQESQTSSDGSERAGDKHILQQLENPITMVVIQYSPSTETRPRTTVPMPTPIEVGFRPDSVAYYYANINTVYICNTLHTPASTNKYDFTFAIVPVYPSLSQLRFTITPQVYPIAGNMIIVNLQRAGIPVHVDNTCHFLLVPLHNDTQGDPTDDQEDVSQYGSFTYDRASNYILTIYLPPLPLDKRLDITCSFHASLLSNLQHDVTAYLTETQSGTYIAAQSSTTTPFISYDHPMQTTKLSITTQGFTPSTELIDTVTMAYLAIVDLLIAFSSHNMRISDIHITKATTVRSYEADGAYPEQTIGLLTKVLLAFAIGLRYDIDAASYLYLIDAWYITDLALKINEEQQQKKMSIMMSPSMSLLNNRLPIDIHAPFHFEPGQTNPGGFQSLSGLTSLPSLGGAISPQAATRWIPSQTDNNTDQSNDTPFEPPVIPESRVILPSRHFTHNLELEVFGTLNQTRLDLWKEQYLAAMPTITAIVQLRLDDYETITGEKNCFEGSMCGSSCELQCPHGTPCKTDFDCLSLVCSTETYTCQG